MNYKNTLLHLIKIKFLIGILFPFGLLIFYLFFCINLHSENRNCNPIYKLRQTQAKELVLENEDLIAVFDVETGALTELTDKNSKWQFQRDTQLALSFQLLVPVNGRRNNPVYGIKQRLESYKLSNDKKSVTFYWTKLHSEYAGILNINLEGKVTLDSTGLKFSMHILNNSSYTIEAIAYPSIGDLSRFNINEEIKVSKVGYSDLEEIQISPIFPNWKGYWGVDNPTLVVNTDNQFILVRTPSHGFYIGCHNSKNDELITYNFELKPGWGIAHGMWAGEYPTEDDTNRKKIHTELRVWHFSYVNPTDSACISPIVIKPFKGSWQNGVDIYKDWRKTWFKRPNTPQWARDVHSWQQVHINSPEDELRCNYKDLIKYGVDCAINGVKAIQLVGWSKGGQDHFNPSHDTDVRLGTWQELKNTIEKIEAKGVRVILFNKYTWADQSTNWFKDELIKFAVKNPYGDYNVHEGYQYQTATQLANINPYRLVPMCPIAINWREIANKEFKKSIDLGASGILFDECQHHGSATYCWDKSHGHKIPAYVFSGDMPLVDGFRSIVNRLNPEFLLAGEGNYDIENTQYSLSSFRIDPFNHIPVKRYIDPWGQIMVQVTGFNDRVMINSCLRNRYIMSYEPFFFKGRLTDFPLSVNYGKKIDALRTKYKDYLWDGEFMDVQGSKVFFNGKPYEFYSVFKHKNENKLAVVIVNNNKYDIEVDVLLKNNNKDLVFVSPENIVEKEVTKVIKISALSAVVVMEK